MLRRFPAAAFVLKAAVDSVALAFDLATFRHGSDWMPAALMTRGYIAPPRERRIRARRVLRAGDPICGINNDFRATTGVIVGALLVVVSLLVAPPANAMRDGSYNLNIQGRYDFHTWIWSVTPCQGDCVLVSALAQPIARAYQYVGEAHLSNGQYALTIDDPFGLRCDNIYYGQTIPTHDVYVWDATTLAGSLQSTSATGCDGAPGGGINYPFTLSRL